MRSEILFPLGLSSLQLLVVLINLADFDVNICALLDFINLYLGGTFDLLISRIHPIRAVTALLLALFNETQVLKPLAIELLIDLNLDSFEFFPCLVLDP